MDGKIFTKSNIDNFIGWSNIFSIKKSEDWIFCIWPNYIKTKRICGQFMGKKGWRSLLANWQNVCCSDGGKCKPQWANQSMDGEGVMNIAKGRTWMGKRRLEDKNQRSRLIILSQWPQKKWCTAANWVPHLLHHFGMTEANKKVWERWKEFRWNLRKGILGLDGDAAALRAYLNVWFWFQFIWELLDFR